MQFHNCWQKSTGGDDHLKVGLRRGCGLKGSDLGEAGHCPRGHKVAEA